jgi:hypothetical protein
MESRLERILSNKLTRRTFLGVLGAALMTPSVATAQLIDPRPPGEVIKPSTPPKIEPIFVPRPLATLSEPQDLDTIIATAAKDMNLTEGYIRRLLHCESTLDPQKINIVSGARGLWQIMPVHAQKFVTRGWDYWQDWSNAFRNTKVAGDIYREQGLKAWDCR